MKNLLGGVLLVAAALSACKKEKNGDEYIVNNTTSDVVWTGSTPVTSNTGSFEVKSTSLVVKNRQIKEGKFVIPIVSIKNFNLPDDVKNDLLNHLKSDDFFNMAVYPNAEFKLTKFETYTGNVEGAIENANYLITGNFSMIGKTNPVSFPARVDFIGDSLKVEGVFVLDRSKWGLNYANDPNLGDHYIYPEVDIHLNVKAGRK